MDSRRIKLLLSGYFNGRLDFKYKNPLSKLREEIVLRHEDQALNEKVLFAKAITDAIIWSHLIPRDSKLFKIPEESFGAFTNLVLPYLAKESKIEEPQKAEVLPEADNLVGWKALLNEANTKHNG